MRNYALINSTLLSELGFTGDIPFLSSDMTGTDAAKVMLATSFFKKLGPSGPTKKATEAAVKKFTEINAALPAGPHSFYAESEAESCFHDFFRDNLRVALDDYGFLRNFDLEYIRDHMMPGPGAAQKADSSTMISKLFESTISYTNWDLVRIYRGALSSAGVWADAEMRRFEKLGFTRVEGGKLFFVTKNADEARTCCTESSLGILIQKACGDFIEERLGYFYRINLKTQPTFNRRMACIGSIDGSITTIDSTSASDSIGLYLIQRDLPNCFLKTVMLRARSSSATLPSGECIDLKMVSTMGNGFTFPLQTLIFACAVRAVYDLMGIPCRNPETDFGVFGDDICVKAQAYEFLVRMLTKLGFTVNKAKSFATGPFRESCGHDYFRGLNVRGVYVKSLETSQQVYSTINRLTRWSAYHGIRIPKTIALLLSMVREIRIPPSESIDGGIQVPSKLMPSTVVDNRYWFQYRIYQKRVRKLVKSDEELQDPDVELGSLCGFLTGVYRRRDISLDNLSVDVHGFLAEPARTDWSVSVSIRDRIGAKSRYQIVRRSLPWWDFMNSSDHDKSIEGEAERYLLTEVSYDAWEGVVAAVMPIRV